MLFNSYLFILAFLPITLIGYYIINHFKQYKLASLWIIGMSMWFYGYSNIYYLLLLVVSILFNYFMVTFLFRFIGRNKIRIFIFILDLGFNIGLLFYYKYYDFFINNVNFIFNTNFNLIHLVLPLGISFFTFQQLSYVIDCFNGNARMYNVLDYISYVTFFPQLTAGPIALHNEMIPQYYSEAKRHINYDNLSKGFYAFGCGLGKKVLLADTFGKIVNIGYSDISILNTTSALIVILCYTFQIYFDFSGYCDMAYGIAYMLNIELPINFNSPYKADSISDFWKRWHITLTRFFTKYIYIPLGGNRKGNARTCLNTLIVFAISGLWHGANWTFIIWGLLNGLGICFNRVTKNLWVKIPHFVRVIITFIFVTFGWSLFRSESINQFNSLMKIIFSFDFGKIDVQFTDAFNNLEEIRILCRFGLQGINDGLPSLFLLLFITLTFLLVLYFQNTQEKILLFTFSTKQLIITIIISFWSIISLAQISEFLYFNF